MNALVKVITDKANAAKAASAERFKQLREDVQQNFERIPKVVVAKLEETVQKAKPPMMTLVKDITTGTTNIDRIFGSSFTGAAKNTFEGLTYITDNTTGVLNAMGAPGLKFSVAPPPGARASAPKPAPGHPSTRN